jgi:cytochrome c-type biogenesis protein CcmF
VAELGQALLAVGFVAATLAVVRASRVLLVASAAALSGAASTLAWALVTSDFSLAYVAETSRRGASAWYRFAALWGGSDGSLILLAVVVAVVAAAAATPVTTRDERRVLAAPVAVLAGAAVFVADPFAAATLTPIDGVGLTPILEHPAMAIHPPLLYLGLAATVPPYAAAAAGALGRAAHERARRWLLLVVGALTAAMALGGLWSYVEAGWGGYWAWDPVENTSLAVWLAALVALHRGIAGRDGPAALPAVLAAAGTALTRSGVVTSVHSFAEDTVLGWTLAGLTAAALAGALVAWHRTRADRQLGRAWREPTSTMGATAVVLLALVLAVVVVGSAAPVARRVTGEPGTAVGGWFYARLVGSVAVVALAALLVAAPVRARVRAVAMAIGAVAAIAAVMGGWGLAGAGLAGAASAAVVTTAAATARGRGPMWLAHLGIAVLLVGVAGTTASEVRTFAFATGSSERVGPVVVTNEGVSAEAGASVVTHLRIQDGRANRRARAALVAYPEWGGLLAETALWSRPWRDVQVTLMRADDSGRAVVEVRVRPLAQLLWWGALLTVAGVWLSARRVSERRPASSGAASPVSSSAQPGPADQERPRQERPRPEPAPELPREAAGGVRRSSGRDPAATASTIASGGPGGRARPTPRPRSGGAR